MRMIDVKACFEKNGFHNVSTYIQSGNVLFGSDELDQTKLTSKVEDVLSAAFKYQSRVVVRSYSQMKAIVARAPKGFGSDPAAYRCDVIFLKEPLTAAEAIKVVTPKAGVDEAFAGKGVLYFSRLTSRASESRLSRVIALPVYQSMTIRNWNTTTKLLELMEMD